MEFNLEAGKVNKIDRRKKGTFYRAKISFAKFPPIPDEMIEQCKTPEQKALLHKLLEHRMQPPLIITN